MTEKISPSIIIPNKAFLVGALYGFNAARKRLEQNPQPVFGTEELDEESPQCLYLGNWLELTCAKCGALYTFTGPNELPESNLICTIKDCGNHIIFYGVADPVMWHIGEIAFV